MVTVQSELERALAAVATLPVRVHCAGRTDTGVHACGQLIHFDTPVTRGLKAWVMGTNTHLPSAVREQRLQEKLSRAVGQIAELSAGEDITLREASYKIATSRLKEALFSSGV